MENESCIINQVIKDKDFVSIDKSEFNKFKIVTEFLLNSHIKKDAIKDIAAYQEALRLRPYVNNHISIKEKILGKSRMFFTPKEREETLNEFYKVYEAANKILSGKVKVEELINEAWEKAN